ncbi:MAG: hypothetical protein R2827_11270 [Bdellovibrionales bacterium]
MLIRSVFPIAHGEGRYYCDQSTINLINDNGQVWLRYAENCGSLQSIAGVMNKEKCGRSNAPSRAGYVCMLGWGVTKESSVLPVY